MTIKQFIEKAIEGGWIPRDCDVMIKNPIAARVEGDRIELQAQGSDGWTGLKSSVLLNGFAEEHSHRILLDPLAWKAVGKVEGWRIKGEWETNFGVDGWLENMHRMIDALAEGKSIEDYLKTL